MSGVPRIYKGITRTALEISNNKAIFKGEHLGCAWA